MKRIGIAWRVVLSLLSIAWIPVVLEEFFEGLFHLSQRWANDPFILIIPYIEFITLPLTCLALLIALYKGAKAITEFMRHYRKPN